MDRGILLAIIGSILVFLIILAVIIYSHSDFDQQLIEQVNNGVPADKLIPQIDIETERLKYNTLRSYQSNLANKDFGKGKILSKRDYELYTEKYESEMKMISEFDAARKKFVRREITKEQFLLEIKNIKEFIEMTN